MTVCDKNDIFFVRNAASGLRGLARGLKRHGGGLHGLERPVARKARAARPQKARAASAAKG